MQIIGGYIIMLLAMYKVQAFYRNKTETKLFLQENKECSSITNIKGYKDSY